MTAGTAHSLCGVDPFETGNYSVEVDRTSAPGLALGPRCARRAGARRGARGHRVRGLRRRWGNACHRHRPVTRRGGGAGWFERASRLPGLSRPLQHVVPTDPGRLVARTVPGAPLGFLSVRPGACNAAFLRWALTRFGSGRGRRRRCRSGRPAPLLCHASRRSRLSWGHAALPRTCPPRARFASPTTSRGATRTGRAR